MKYIIVFSGRLKNALGYTYACQETIEAASEKEAIIKLYDKYESVHHPVIKIEEE